MNRQNNSNCEPGIFLRRITRLAGATFLLATFAVEAAPLGILVPAYFYPGSLWNSMSNAALRVPLIAIMNPNSGPGASQDPNYIAAVNNLRHTGAQVIGYVSTAYATRLLAQVEADIDSYLSWYTLDGIFLDEMTNDSNITNLNYYATLYQYIKAKNARLSVIANPGTNTEEDYLNRPTADTLVIFEDSTGYASFTPSGWVTNHLARQFVHLPYNISTAGAMSNAVALAVSRNAGWVYVTHDGGSNPWDTLPFYWTNEVALIQSLNQSAPSTRLALTGITNRIPSL